MFQRDSSHVLRIWKVKSGTGFILIVTVTSGEEGQDDEELELELFITKLVYLLSSTKISF